MSIRRMFFITHYQREQRIAVRNIAEGIKNVLNRGEAIISGSGVYSSFVSDGDYIFTTELGGRGRYRK